MLIVTCKNCTEEYNPHEYIDISSLILREVAPFLNDPVTFEKKVQICGQLNSICPNCGAFNTRKVEYVIPAKDVAKHMIHFIKEHDDKNE